jgi:solute carrier family 25 carnitine/acylcarnitine transporter 20/29
LSFLKKGFAGILSSYPFDTIKVRIQNQNANNLKYKGAIDCLRKIIAKESVNRKLRISLN